jgi:hypothetical protein
MDENVSCVYVHGHERGVSRGVTARLAIAAFLQVHEAYVL